MFIVCLDLESILIPEIWKNAAKIKGIKDLELTTREVPDYDFLMKHRMKTLMEHKIKFKDLILVIKRLKPIRGALSFLDWLKLRAPVVILSDTFYELSSPVMLHLGSPFMLCHSLLIDKEGYISDYTLRMPDSKREAVLAFQRLGYKVIAVGDSYNDLSMLDSADIGILFHPPESFKKILPSLPVVTSFYQLKQYLRKILNK